MITFYHFLLFLAVSWGISLGLPQTSLEWQIEREKTISEGLLTIQNTALQAISPLPIEIEVLGVIISTEEPKWLEPLIMCESGGNPNAWNKEDPNGGSFGILQFQIPTFYSFAKKYDLENPNIDNPEQQIWLAKKMISDGLQYKWSCWNK